MADRRIVPFDNSNRPKTSPEKTLSKRKPVENIRPLDSRTSVNARVNEGAMQQTTCYGPEAIMALNVGSVVAESNSAAYGG